MGGTVFDYIRDPQAIYDESFRQIRAETVLSGLEPEMEPVAVRMVHACAMPAITRDMVASPGIVATVRRALGQGATILTDVRMVSEGIIRSRLPADNPIVCTLNEPNVADHAASIRNTRSAAAVDFWDAHLNGAVVVIGNAPTALFRLLERLEQNAPKPAAILGFPVGFVGAAESKDALIACARGIPFLTLRGRLGGSAMAAAALNAMTGDPA